MSKDYSKGPYLIGRGILTWSRLERVCNRYGFVWLMDRGDSRTPTCEVSEITVPENLIGKICQMSALIIETRKSTHIGDVFRGIGPRTPEAGREFLLGEGILTVQRRGDPDRTEVGLTPVNGRDTDWLDVRALYDCHEQTVELRVEQL